MEISRNSSIFASEMKGCWKSRCPLKELTHKLSLAGTHLGHWQRESGLVGIRDMQGETELGGFHVRGGGTSVIVPVLNPLPTWPTGAIAPVLSPSSLSKSEQALA